MINVDKSSSSASPALPNGIFWRLLRGIIAFLNDRFLPAKHSISAEAVLTRLESAVVWFQQTLMNCDPGPLQYRGLPLDPPSPTQPTTTREILYRGCRLEVTALDPSNPSEKPYVPTYQRRLKTWVVNLGLGDMDSRADTPQLERVYRGREF
ncbi:MAG: hypothetical protein NW237_10260 [Cyanobacteriota bacterium]|nr:hypothetical protein [Cyanobacteriota bacterium]